MSKDIPINWGKVSVELVSEIFNGQTPKKISSVSGVGEIPWFRISDMNKVGNEKFLTTAEVKLTQDEVDSLRLHLRPKGTIVFPKRGGAIATNKKRILNQVSTFDLNTMGLLPYGINHSYFWYWFSSINLAALSDGSNVPQLNLKNIVPLQVPIPPIKEQKRIVEKLELLLSKLDKAVEALESAQEKLKNYRRAILKAAVEGELSKEWREENKGKLEPASKLVKHMLLQHRHKWEETELIKMRAKDKNPKNDKWKEKYKEPISANLKQLSSLPNNWTWATFDQISDRVTVGHVGSMKNEYVDQGIPFLRSLNVRENRFEAKGLKYITKEFNSKLSKSELKPNDLVVVRSGSVGTACVIPEHLPEANCSDLVIVKNPKVNPYFCAFYMNSVAKEYVLSKQVGVALIHFNTSSMAALSLPIPPIEEQNYIVETVQSILSVIEKLENEIIVQFKQSKKLRQSILKKAFVGQIVSQDRNDEPASELLARIQAEREASKPKPKSKKTKSKKVVQPRLLGDET